MQLQKALNLRNFATNENFPITLLSWGLTDRNKLIESPVRLIETQNRLMGSKGREPKLRPNEGKRRFYLIKTCPKDFGMQPDLISIEPKFINLEAKDLSLQQNLITFEAEDLLLQP
jgi:hypothetical protein